MSDSQISYRTDKIERGGVNRALHAKQIAQISCQPVRFGRKAQRDSRTPNKRNEAAQKLKCRALSRLRAPNERSIFQSGQLIRFSRNRVENITRCRRRSAKHFAKRFHRRSRGEPGARSCVHVQQVGCVVTGGLSALSGVSGPNRARQRRDRGQFILERQLNQFRRRGGQLRSGL